MTRWLACGLTLLFGACAPFRVLSGPPPVPEPASANATVRLDSRLHAEPLELAVHDDAIVRVVAGGTSCTGTLIDEDLVLTAHHCVAERGPYGEYLEEHVSLGEVRVELGGDYLPWGQVSVRRVVAPPCGFGAGVGDIAVLILDRALSGVDVREVDLDTVPAAGTVVEPVGFGSCATSEDGIRRHSRQGGPVAVLRPTRFQMDAAVCPGDSGGPAIDQETGRVLGVLSASVMDGSEVTVSLTEFTRVDKWRSVLSTARQIASGANPSELPPLDCTIAEPG